MKKLIVALSMLAAGSSVFACNTNPLPDCTTKLVDYTCVGEQLVSSREYTDSVTWVHNIAVEEGYTVSSVNGATLEITSLGVNNLFEQNDKVKVYFMDNYLGNLQASRIVGCPDVTTFNMSNNQTILDGIFNSITSGSDMEVQAKLKFVADSGSCFNWDIEDVVDICQSKLTVCVSQYKDSNTENPTVPAPAAVLLSGVGTVLAGTVRRRSL